MIKACKWCGKEQEMRGKREFCPGDKCKNAYKYAKRTGKLETGKRLNTQAPTGPIDRPEGLNEVAGAYWDEIAPLVTERGHLNILSAGAFAELCDLYSILQSSDGKDDNIKLRYSKQFLDYCKAFYLTPLSNRGNFGLPEKKEKEEDKGERFFS